MKLHLASDEAEAQLWEQFVENHAECSNYHRWGWKQVIENSFHWPTYYLMLEEANSIRGILPLVWQRSRMFGSFLTSLPFLNCGGVVAETKATKDALAVPSARPAALAKACIQFLQDQERLRRLALAGIHSGARKPRRRRHGRQRSLKLHSAHCEIT